jgi:hypothetical protein
MAWAGTAGLGCRECSLCRREGSIGRSSGVLQRLDNAQQAGQCGEDLSILGLGFADFALHVVE